MQKMWHMPQVNDLTPCVAINNNNNNKKSMTITMTSLCAFSWKKQFNWKWIFFSQKSPKRHTKKKRIKNLIFGDVYSSLKSHVLGESLLFPKTVFTFLPVWFRCRLKRKKSTAWTVLIRTNYNFIDLPRLTMSWWKKKIILLYAHVWLGKLNIQHMCKK